MPQRALFISHGHPSTNVGGAELYAYHLCKEIGGLEGWESTLLARTISDGYRFERGTPFRSPDDGSDDILWLPDGYDPFFLTNPDKEHFSIHFDRLLREIRPDVVDIQHTAGLGLDIVRQVRSSLPDVPIVYTLHEYQPICHNRGLMLRTTRDELCLRASPQRCHDCFPNLAPQSFFLRERLAKAHLRHVDLFLAPSRFLLERYVEWGVREDRIRYQPYGLLIDPGETTPEPDEREPPISRFGFFGQLAQHKGIFVLLEALRSLVSAGIDDLRVYLNGCNLEFQTPEFRDRLDELCVELRDHVVLLGKYDRADLRALMADVAWVVVPSIWWENSPLVIQEAFAFGRPVICSDIGGMAEKVEHGVNGLHFAAGDPLSLAETLRAAARSRTGWRRLRSGIPAPYTLREAARAQVETYRSLLAGRQSRVCLSA